MVYELVNVYCREMSTVVGHPYGHESLVKDVYCRKMSTIVDLEFHVST